MSRETLVDRYDGLLLDLDGVVYIGPEAVPGAVPALSLAKQHGCALAYVTNNAARPAVQVSEHLQQLGLPARPDEVVTSAQVAAAIARGRLGAGAKVLCVGGPGIGIAVEAEGMTIVASAHDGPDVVIQGFGPEICWADLAEASYAIQGGADWIATNTDLTIPQPRGTAPGCGSLINAVRQAVDVDPTVAGKPQPVAFQEAARRAGSRRPLVVGDRLDTDIQGGVAAGIDSLMVLTGVHGVSELLAAPHFQRPTYVAPDLGALLVPVVESHVDGNTAKAGDVFVVARGGHVHLDSGDDPLNALRASLALVWAGADRGEMFDLSPDLAQRVRSVRAGR